MKRTQLLIQDCSVGSVYIMYKMQGELLGPNHCPFVTVHTAAIVTS